MSLFCSPLSDVNVCEIFRRIIDLRRIITTYRIRSSPSGQDQSTHERTEQERNEDTVEYEPLESRSSERDESICLGNVFYFNLILHTKNRFYKIYVIADETDDSQVDIESTSSDRQELCFKLIKRCCFLLLCVRGPNSLQAIAEQEESDTEEEDENKVEHFYRSLEEGRNVSRGLKKRCDLLIKFICGYTGSQSNWTPQLEVLDYNILYRAMISQHERAEVS